MPSSNPLFQGHHALEQQVFAEDPLLQALVESGRFHKDVATNLINLPSDRALAHTLGVSPHSGGPLRAYKTGTMLALSDLASTKDGIAALNGDEGALDRMAMKVQRLSDAAQVALVNGELHTNAGLNQTRDQARAITNAFFDDPISNSPTSYASKNVMQMDAHGQASWNTRQWAVVTHNEGRIVSTLNHLQSSGQPLTRGGNLDLQRHGLSQAISDAYHGGELTLSPGGVAVVENTLGAEAARPLRVPRGQSGAASMEVLLGNASASTLVRSGGLLATGADAVLTARRSAELLEQGNATAAQSEVTHALARNFGGWAGGASTAAALGGSGFVPAALVVGDALLMSKAFDKGADLLDNRAIYHQTDKTGVEWQFNGRNWQREAAIDLAQDGRRTPGEQPVVASYGKSQELGALANAKAVELALGKATPPQDPFNLPAQASDQVGLDNRIGSAIPSVRLGSAKSGLPRPAPMRLAATPSNSRPRNACSSSTRRRWHASKATSPPGARPSRPPTWKTTPRSALRLTASEYRRRSKPPKPSQALCWARTLSFTSAPVQDSGPARMASPAATWRWSWN